MSPDMIRDGDRFYDWGTAQIKLTCSDAGAQTPLELIALDADDLAVHTGAHVQDARVQDRRHCLAAGRKAAGGRHEPARLGADVVGRNRPARLAALRFDRVLALQSRSIDLDQPEAVLELVEIDSIPASRPAVARAVLLR